VPSERWFSKAGEVVAARTSNIQPKNVDVILRLNKNLLCFGIAHFLSFFFFFLFGGDSIIWYCISIHSI